VPWGRDQGRQVMTTSVAGCDGTTVSKATEEREREHGVEKLLSVMRQSAAPEILGQGT
jgi:hypothetical protein